MSHSAAPSINLIPQDPFFASPVGKIIQWALSIGRYIVIFTELIVIISFVSRFSIDRQITDLNEEIFNKQAIVESYAAIEQQFRQVQKAAQDYDLLRGDGTLADNFPELIRVTPPSISLSQLDMSENAIILAGSSSSTESIQRLVNNLALLPIVESLSISSITTNTELEGTNPYIFSIDIVTRAAASEEAL